MSSNVSDRQPPKDKRWRAIAFDLDDTLYPETQFVRSGFKAVALWSKAKFNFEPDSTFRELIDLFDDGVRGTVFDSWLAKHGLPTAVVGEMVDVYRDHNPRIAPFPGVRKMLSELQTEFRLGLLSDGVWVVQERKFSALGVRDYFDAVVFSDRLGRAFWKPSVQPFLELMKILEVESEETVYVGDNPAKDFVACKQLGMHSIWFRRSTGIYSSLTPQSDSCPDYIVNSIAKLTDVLKTGRGTVVV